jgi:hypothetical protein
MASIDQFAALLVGTNIELVTEQNDAFVVRFLREDFVMPRPEVDNYLAVQKLIVNEPETAIYHAGYYEHLIEQQAFSFRFRRSMGEDDKLELASQDGTLSVEVSLPSAAFILHMFQSAYFNTIRRRIHSVGLARQNAQDQEGPTHLRTAFRRFVTIKVLATDSSPYRLNRTRLRHVAQSAMFHFAYGIGEGVSLAPTWDRTNYKLALAQSRNEKVQFPRRTYDTDLVSYYQLALSSNSLMLSYISLYKILEHFFSSASETALHSRLADKLIQPQFSHAKPTQLRELAALIRKHDQRMDEPRMLTTVLEKHFRPDELIAWVQEYENTFGAHYTAPRELFSETVALDVSPDKIASSLAKRIYHIRNVLVHNKEGELPRFVPFSGQEKVLANEVPVVQYLAEQLILRSGKDL